VATWRIYSNLRTTYHHPRAAGGAVQDCGRPNGAEYDLDDVLVWVVAQGDAGDYVRTPTGVLVVQARAQA
jgi:hypothetical protein